MFNFEQHGYKHSECDGAWVKVNVVGSLKILFTKHEPEGKNPAFYEFVVVPVADEGVPVAEGSFSADDDAYVKNFIQLVETIAFASAGPGPG